MDTQTRHALKEDKLVHATQTGIDWLQDNRTVAVRWAVIVAVVLILVIAGSITYSSRSTAAALKLGAALDTYGSPLAQPGQPATPGQKTFPTAVDRAKAANQQFVAVANQYRLLRAGKNARYFAGITAIAMGQPGEAETDLQQVVDSHGANLSSLAKLALAGLYAQTNRSAQAVALYQQLIANPTSTVPANAAQLQLAALYETTNPGEATRIYAQLKTEKSAAGEIAAQKLSPK